MATANDPTDERPHYDSDKKSKRFFFLVEDTVVFKADDKLFRVHRSILQRDSEFFRDLFMAPRRRMGWRERRSVGQSCCLK